ARFQMRFQLVHFPEPAGALHDVVDAEILPGKLGGIRLREHLEGIAVDDDLLASQLDGALVLVMHAVEAERVRQMLRFGEIVDRDDVEMFAQLGDPSNDAADAAESVDGDPRYGHLSSSVMLDEAT